MIKFKCLKFKLGRIQLDGTKIEEDNLKRDTLLFDVIKRRYDAEWDKIAGLDSKANNFIGFISVVTGLYFFGTGLLLVSIGFALSAIKIRRWHAVPNVETLLNKYTSMPLLQIGIQWQMRF